MAEQPRAIIVSLCKDCGGVIDVEQPDVSSGGGTWNPPKEGHVIELDVITLVELVVEPRHRTGLPFYRVWLDTKAKPHCDAAKS